MTEPHPDLLSSITEPTLETAEPAAPPAGVPPTDDSADPLGDRAMEGLDPVAAPAGAEPSPRIDDLSDAVDRAPPHLDLASAAGREDVAQPATRDDLLAMKRELAAQIAALEPHLGEKMQFQGWAILAGVALLLAIAAAVFELF